MKKKTVFINENFGKLPKKTERKLTAQDRRRAARWEKQVAYAAASGIEVGYSATDDGPEYEINQDPMDKVDKAVSFSFPRDTEKVEEVYHEDVMHRVVNHAHQRDPKKKW